MCIPILLADAATIIASIVGPLIGVLMAHIFSKQQSRNVAAADLFRRIIEDSENYRFSFIVARLSTSTLDAIHEGIHAMQVKHILIDSAINQNIAVRQEMVKLNCAIGLLKADQLSLRILFDKQAEKCIQAINKLIGWNAKFNKTDIEPDYAMLILDDLRAISADVEELAKKLKWYDEVA